MKKIQFLLFGILLILSCNNNVTKRKTKCKVVSCDANKIISVHDEINKKQKWSIKTSCGKNFISFKPYKKGDSVEIFFVTVK